jgi:hypothetical protein
MKAWRLVWWNLCAQEIKFQLDKKREEERIVLSLAGQLNW